MKTRVSHYVFSTVYPTFSTLREELGALQRDIGIVDTGHHEGTEWQLPQWHGIESA
jgi:hypothetical protein